MNFKKVSAILAVSAMVLGVTGLTAMADDNWKVAILTGTVSQGEEEFRAAEKAIAQTKATQTKLSGSSDRTNGSLIDELLKKTGNGGR